MKMPFKLNLVCKRLTFAVLFLTSSSVFAIDPVPGIYAGVMLGVSYSPKLDFNLINPNTGLLTSGVISQTIFGNIAGQFGYRINHFRVEGELLVNNNPYKYVEFDNITVHKSGNFNLGLGQQGQATTGAFMVNGFYDFYSTNSSFSPYLGLGIGYAYIQNKVSFYNNNVVIPNSSITETSKKPAAQLVLGAGYFADDFTFIGLDYRHLETGTLGSPFTSRYQLNTVNLTIGGSFDRG